MGRRAGRDSYARTRSSACLVSSDGRLVDTVHRIAAAAGCPLRVTAGLGEPWRDDLLLIGADALSTVARSGRAVGPVIVVAGDAAALDAAVPGGAVSGAGRARPRSSVWQEAASVGAEHVIVLPDAEEWLADRLSRCADGPERDGVVVATIGGCGGAGASVLACVLAATAAAEGLAALLVDADPMGGGIDLALGAEDSTGLRWPDLAEVRGSLRRSSLAAALPVVDGLTVLSWDRGEPIEVSTQALTSVLQAGRGGYDLTVVDVPRHLGTDGTAALAQTDVLLLVVPATVRATSAATRVLRASRPLVADIRVVVRGPASTALPADAVADALDLPLAAHLRPDAGLAAALDLGQGPLLRARSPLRRWCRAFVAAEVGRPVAA